MVCRFFLEGGGGAAGAHRALSIQRPQAKSCLDVLPDNDVPFEEEEVETFVGQSRNDGPSSPAGLLGVDSKKKRSGTSIYGSDDDDYDRIFQELILREEEESHVSSAPTLISDEHDDDYDHVFEELILREERKSQEYPTVGPDIGRQDEDMMDISHC